MNLTKIGFFNPGRLNDEEIESSFIARNALFELLFDEIVEQSSTSIPQHLLIIGQRGMGKTSLLMRLAVELKKNPFNKKFIPLTFPEEQYNIDKLSKFWLNSLDALADALDREGKTKTSEELDADISRLTSGIDLDDKQPYTIFKKWVSKINRRPVLLVDNLNLIFNKISTEDQHKLRAILISKGAPIMVGASTIVVVETVDYGAPFYDAFQTHYLKKLSLDESIEIFRKLGQLTGKSLSNAISGQKGRMKALYQLTGGTPRTMTMLFPLIADGFSENIQDDLDALLDVVTPLYKARFEELAPQMQVVLDAVALNWDPVDLEKLRSVTQLDNAKLSPQLKRLVDVGWIQKLKSNKSKGGLYEISESFFNVWYIMRRSSRRMKRELYCLSKFLESFYGTEVEQLAQNRLQKKHGSKESAYLDLALAEAVGDEKLEKNLRKKGYDTLFTLNRTDPSVLKSFEIPREIIDKEIGRLVNQWNGHLKKEEWDKMKVVAEEMLAIEVASPIAVFAHAISLEGLLELSDAENEYKKVIEIDPKNWQAWNGLGNLYKDQLNRYEESEAAYKKAIELDANFAYPWNGLGNLYQDQLSRYEESEAAYKKAIELDANFAYPWNGLGNLYQAQQSRYEESEAAYKKAIALDANNAYPWYGLGNLYKNQLSRYEESEAAYKKAIELDANFAYPWNGLGNLYQNQLSRYEESEAAYKKAIELDANTAYPWNGLGNLYQDQLSRYEESEAAYKKAIELDANFAYPWNGLGNLYKNQLSRYEESETAYKKAIELDANFAYPWHGLGNLYQDYLNKYDKAEAAYKKAIDLSGDSAYPKYNLTFLFAYRRKNPIKVKSILETISETERIRDVHFLLQAILAYTDDNAGIAREYITSALEEIKEELPTNAQDDWRRAAAIAVGMGYGRHFADILKENGYHIILRPYYEAIIAMTEKESQMHFNTVSAEVRKPAMEIYEMMQRYLG
ncbi:MAG: tetratricopeptide repeat protein [Cytophagales bacterium]|nr:tetratricopeptide repeat protein [Cytophagales bacterium]